MPSSSLCDHVSELLEPLGNVRIRAMFGGFGVYHRDLFFGIIIDDVLYLKVDETTRERFTTRELRPFVYPSKNGPMVMAYHEAPPEALDDGEVMIEWVRAAIEVAARARSAKTTKKPSAKKPAAQGAKSTAKARPVAKKAAKPVAKKAAKPVAKKAAKRANSNSVKKTSPR